VFQAVTVQAQSPASPPPEAPRGAWPVFLQAFGGAGSLPWLRYDRRESSNDGHVMFGLGLGYHAHRHVTVEADAAMARRFPDCLDECGKADATQFTLAGLWPTTTAAWGMQIGPSMTYVRTDTTRLGIGVKLSVGKLRGSGVGVAAQAHQLNGPGAPMAFSLVGVIRLGHYWMPRDR
jgi:hypothetical protein